jgi:hypothetical protein
MFRTHWSTYSVANKLESIPVREKIAALLSTIGDDCLKFYNNLPLTENERNTADKILDSRHYSTLFQEHDIKFLTYKFLFN